mmetsp:Transcript_150964/g.263818  ORF Transcript_150964/g.263818 Transcript_150964/m.263818 type:complete len:97 (-) Transcript_150964:16-306(-)
MTVKHGPKRPIHTVSPAWDDGASERHGTQGGGRTPTEPPTVWWAMALGLDGCPTPHQSDTDRRSPTRIPLGLIYPWSLLERGGGGYTRYWGYYTRY